VGRLRIALAIASLTVVAFAALASEHDRVRALREAGTILPLERILENLRADRQGRVLEAELEYDDGRYAYEIELVDDAGIVWELWYDAATGKLIRSEQE